MPPFVILQEFLGLRDVSFLRVLAAAKEKQDEPIPFFGKIDAISWSAVNPQFPYTVTKMFVVAQIAQAGAVKSDANPGPAIYVSQALEPFPERRRAVFFLVVIDFVGKYLHAFMLAYKLQDGKERFVLELDARP